jgi:hypothetical protein
VNKTEEMESEIMAAERAVEAAKEKLVAELEAASETGREAIERVVHNARPVAIAVAAVAGVALVAGAVALVRASLSRPRAPSFLLAPRQRSFFGQMARQALTSAAGALAATVARRLLVSLEDETERTNQRSNGHGTRVRRNPMQSQKTAPG